MFYSTGVTNDLVQTLGKSKETSPGLPSLKPSSIPFSQYIVWIIRPAMDLSPKHCFVQLFDLANALNRETTWLEKHKIDYYERRNDR